AELALRRRVKKSAIGSVIVMMSLSTFLTWFPGGPGLWRSSSRRVLPAGLAHARQFTAVRHLAQAHPAQAELAVHRVRPAALLAPGVGPHGELRLALRLGDQCLLGHGISSP